MSRAVARQTKTKTTTDQERITAVLEQLAAHGVAYWFDMRGGTGVREDRYNDYIAAAERAGTDRWVGEHVGHREHGGAFWDEAGVLCGRGDFGRTGPWSHLWWSFNHDIPELAELLVRLFTEQGFDASWSGDPYECVIVDLGSER